MYKNIDFVYLCAEFWKKKMPLSMMMTTTMCVFTQYKNP